MGAIHYGRSIKVKDGYWAQGQPLFGPFATEACAGAGSRQDQPDAHGHSATAPAAAESGPSEEVAAILAIEGDLAYGRFLSSECTACHIGAGGDDIPSIRGLPPAAFVAGLADYRSGARQHQVMNTLSARLGDEEIAALAAYFLSESD